MSGHFHSLGKQFSTGMKKSGKKKGPLTKALPRIKIAKPGAIFGEIHTYHQHGGGRLVFILVFFFSIVAVGSWKKDENPTLRHLCAMPLLQLLSTLGPWAGQGLACPLQAPDFPSSLQVYAYHLPRYPTVLGQGNLQAVGVQVDPSMPSI